MSLTNQEKIDIIDSHIKSSEKNEYNLYLSILTEQEKENNDTIVASLEKQLDDEKKKQVALKAEKEKIK